jgi:LPS-assembly protein
MAKFAKKDPVVPLRQPLDDGLDNVARAQSHLDGGTVAVLKRVTLLWFLLPMRLSIGVSVLGTLTQLVPAFIFLASAPGLRAQEPLPQQAITQEDTSTQKSNVVLGKCTYPVVQKEPGVATLQADSQHRTGNTSYADGCVEIDYDNLRLRADHVEYNDDTKVAVVRGNVQLDRLSQHLEADDGRYNLGTDSGVFHHVRATISMQRRPTPTLLVSPNPLYFEADEAERLDENTYRVHRAWITVCRPDKPTWKFFATEATVQMTRDVRLENSTFRLINIPVIYLPFATIPASRQRESGFMIPDAGNSSIKGYFFGDSVYWAPTDWADATVGATYLSKRGWSQNASIRMRPWENAKLDVSYFGVIDRGLPEPNGPPLREGGHEAHFDFDAFLPEGWRTVVDLNQLSSLTFRLAFAETFSQAVNSEVRNTAFATNNFSGFSFSVAALSYKDFLSATPESSITLRSAPEVRVSSVPQQAFQHLPLYFYFIAFEGGVHRSESTTGLSTDSFVQRSEVAPSVMFPFHWGLWLGVTSSFTLRSTHYGEQESISGNRLVDQPLTRTTEEISIDMRPPALERVWKIGDTKWKHTIEPEIVYNYVNGVNEFGRFIRFDEDETLTDTNEIQYGITQRLFRRSSDDDGGEEFITWDLKQKYFFDPTFGGALLPGVRNVFQALDSLTPFAFQDEPNHFSPIISDIRITPGRAYDAQFRVDFDPTRGRITAIGTLLKLKPYRESFLTLAHFSTINLPPAVPSATFRPRSDQIRALVGYGETNRRGWNTAVGVSYDIAEHTFQNQVAQLSYNGSCCGLGLEYRHLNLGTLRTENQYRIVLLIANLGSAGNLRRQEKIF